MIWAWEETATKKQSCGDVSVGDTNSQVQSSQLHFLRIRVAPPRSKMQYQTLLYLAFAIIISITVADTPDTMSNNPLNGL